MDFNEFVNERMEGVLETYEKMQLSKELLALESLAEFAESYEYLEEGKVSQAFGGHFEDFLANKKIKDLKMGKKSFLKYLKKKYPDFQESEITGAKTKEEMDAIREKYINDFKNWAKSSGHLQGIGWHYLASAATMFILPPIHLYFVICFWGSVIRFWTTKKAIKKGRDFSDKDYSHVEVDDRSFN